MNQMSAIVDAKSQTCKLFGLDGRVVPVVFGVKSHHYGMDHVAVYVQIEGTMYIGWYVEQFPNGNIHLQEKKFLALAKTTQSGGIIPPLEPPLTDLEGIGERNSQNVRTIVAR